MSYATGGIAGDINQIQLGGNVTRSFSSALVTTFVGQANARTAKPGEWRGIVLTDTGTIATSKRLSSTKRTKAALAVLTFAGRRSGDRALAQNLESGDENVRLGITVSGAIASPGDIDVYRFTGTAGSMVWLDVDRTSGGLEHGGRIDHRERTHHRLERQFDRRIG